MLRDLYEMAAKIHRLSWMARHEKDEARRFLGQAREAKSNEERAMLEKVASEHEELSQQYQQAAERKREERMTLVF